MFETFRNRLELTGTLTTITALKIGAGRSVEPTDPDVPVIKDANGHPLIPGSSFKGALRSRLESFLRGIFGSDRKLVGDPSNEDEWSLNSREISALKKLGLEQLLVLNLAKQDTRFRTLSLEDLIERIKTQQIRARDVLAQDAFEQLKMHSTDDSALTNVILQNTDYISRLFGSPWLASKVQIRDLTVQDGNWFGQYQERDGVAIDRDTETAADKRKYDFQVVPAGTIFDFKATAENLEEAELGLLMLGLTQFENEMIPLGGGISRGLGVVRLDLTEMIWVDSRNPENPNELLKDKLIEYMQNLVSNHLQPYVLSQPQMTTHKNNWIKALIAALSPSASSA